MTDIAYAMGPIPGGGAPGGMSVFIPLILMFAVFYFLLIRPQQKKTRQHQDLLKSLKVGDRVVTTGGIYGTIVAGGDHVIKLEIADRVRVDVGRSYIAGKVETKEAKEVKETK
ncbi:MAG TPA: preprotein translocase subunit YajC [Candidatus Acidoferrum sp.]|nr:preprotein translocase subunit YajC [Candidatus Acidoferrum sp.]